MATPALTPTLRQNLRERLASARGQTDSLFALIRPAAIHDRPIPERHRMIFYLGHLEAFDWNLMATGALRLESFDPALDKLFSFGIDPVDGNLPSDQLSDWPSVGQVNKYNARVREKLDAELKEALEGNGTKSELADGTLLHVAIEHRLMHAETLAYLLHEMSFDRKFARPETHQIATSLYRSRTVPIPEGSATLGQRRSGGEFGWDNEFEEFRVRVPSFRIDAFPVSNAKFLEFVQAGGYEDPVLWRADDWDWKTKAGLSYPHFWVRRGAEWFWRGMFEEIPLRPAWPVYVSHAEASAFARWAGKSLPTEAQWHRAAYGTPDGPERSYPWGNDPPAAQHGNFDFRLWDPTPINAYPAGTSAFGVYDLLGNGWEWTRTPFRSLPGFKAFPFYPGYSANFFDEKHFVMKGGSSRTAACLMRRSFRNWFQPHYSYVFSKFRCVEE